ncbi:hypothetical protein D3C77_730530 [compost metagenome]
MDGVQYEGVSGNSLLRVALKVLVHQALESAQLAVWDENSGKIGFCCRVISYVQQLDFLRAPRQALKRQFEARFTDELEL